ncbi:MAG: hypothetical protein HRT92_11640 [Piscirickettsiaceae bacterium]|nr:hypothetical protein [Piscirickettsiaceae bacterium]
MNFFKKMGVALSSGVALLVASAPSHAVITSGDLTTSLSAITTDATTVFDAVLPVMLTVMGLVIGYKLVKRFVNGI